MKILKNISNLQLFKYINEIDKCIAYKYGSLTTYLHLHFVFQESKFSVY